MVPAQPTARIKSRLESLPVEIIQDIFLRSLEINLPQASIHLARALSHPTIYTWLIRLLFIYTNKGPERPFWTPGFLPPQVDMYSLDAGTRRNLRTQILQCRWCTLPLIRRCQKEFIQHVIDSECRNVEFSPEDHATLKRIPSLFDNLEGYDRALNGHRSKGDLVLRARFRPPESGTPPVDCQVSVWLNLGVVQLLRKAGMADLDRGTFELPVCEGSQMPDKLLRPPWTDDKWELLQLLSTSAYIDEDNSHPRASRALRQVIRDRDITTFKRLLSLYVRMQCYRFPIPWPVLPNEFHAALKYADGDDDEFVAVLVKDRWRDIPDKEVRLKDKLLAKIGMDWRGF